MKNTRSNQTRHIPQRTCIGCGEVKPKRELIRLISNKDNMVEIDPTGKKAGRGAYLCYAPPCWEKGLKRERLERALRKKISLENQAQLMELGKTLSHRKINVDKQGRSRFTTKREY